MFGDAAEQFTEQMWPRKSDAHAHAKQVEGHHTEQDCGLKGVNLLNDPSEADESDGEKQRAESNHLLCSSFTEAGAEH